ncbi:MAG: TIGR00730 family Rossman fold protein [Coriobacteriaceae bacterium]|nr:TIGR00730 family Rossman fold protein [Coriobacteriaceae bacterium]
MARRDLRVSPDTMDTIREGHMTDKPTGSNANGTTPPEAENGAYNETYTQGPIIRRGNQVPATTTSKRLLSPSANDADWLHADPWRVLRIQAEFVDGFGALAEVGPAVACFGSARTKSNDPMYRHARRIGHAIAKRGVAVITGGGPGIMEAVNRGATLAGGVSIGLGIELPFEEQLNRWVNLGMTFRYFFVRKTMFMKYSQGSIFFPGGFGTMDELFELLTLVQTQKVDYTPVVLFGSDYWHGLIDWLRGSVERFGNISAADHGLYRITDDEAEAVELVCKGIESE